jgi:uncharacterized protein (TIGR02284 family)
MAADNTHDIRVLNGLLAATQDNAEGYHEVAEASEDPGHRALFQARERDRRDVADQLRAAVAAMGGEPDHGGSILAKAQRAVMDIKHALMPDTASVLGEVESGETALLGRFDRALDDDQVSATTRETIRRARTEVATGHEAVTALKQSLQGQRDADSSLFPK